MKGFIFALPLFFASLVQASEPVQVLYGHTAVTNVPVKKCGLFSFLKSGRCPGDSSTSSSTTSSSSG